MQVVFWLVFILSCLYLGTIDFYNTTKKKSTRADWVLVIVPVSAWFAFKNIIAVLLSVVGLFVGYFIVHIYVVAQKSMQDRKREIEPK